MTDRYTLSDAAKAADVSPDLIKAWRKRGQLVIGDDSGGWTRYSLEDLLRIALVAELSRLGVSVRAAAEVVMGMKGEGWLYQDRIISWRPDRPDKLMNSSARETLAGLLVMHADHAGGWTDAPDTWEPMRPAESVAVLNLSAIRVRVYMALDLPLLEIDSQYDPEAEKARQLQRLERMRAASAAYSSDAAPEAENEPELEKEPSPQRG